MGEELDLTIRRENLLAAMGIQVWHRRGVSSASVQSANAGHVSRAEPAPGQGQVPGHETSRDERPADLTSGSESASVTPQLQEPAIAQLQQTIEFVWWCGAHGMALVEPMHTLDEKLLHDVVAAMDWRSTGHTAKLVTGHFRWPQLATTAGKPDRAMAAFFETNGPEKIAWFLVSGSMVDELSEFLPRDCELHALPETLNLASQKREFWQSLGSKSNE